MFWLVVVTLIIIGMAFLLLEILVIPGTGVAGIVGFIIIGVGVWQAYSYYDSYVGHWVLAGTMIGTIIIVVYALQAKTWKRASLFSAIDSKVNLIDEDKLKAGDIGKSVSRLVPGGKAKFNNEFYEVRSVGSFIDPQQDIVIEKIEDHKIFVKLKQ